MVMVIHNCQCETCPGSVSPKSNTGEMVFGGSLCNCPCHVGWIKREKFQDALSLLKQWEKSQWKDFVREESDLLRRTYRFTEQYEPKCEIKTVDKHKFLCSLKWIDTNKDKT